MAHIHVVSTPLLQSSAQLYLLPVSADASVLDPVLNRCKTLFVENHQQYRQACIDGLLPAGTSLLVQRRLQHLGLGVTSNQHQPSYIANLAVTTHATHPIRKRWLSQALQAIYPQLYRLIRYHGLRRIALLAKPLLARNPALPPSQLTQAKVPILQWQDDIYPLVLSELATLPKVRIDIHLPKAMLG